MAQQGYSGCGCGPLALVVLAGLTLGLLAVLLFGGGMLR